MIEQEIINFEKDFEKRIEEYYKNNYLNTKNINKLIYEEQKEIFLKGTLLFIKIDFILKSIEKYISLNNKTNKKIIRHKENIEKLLSLFNYFLEICEKDFSF